MAKTLSEVLKKEFKKYDKESYKWSFNEDDCPVKVPSGSNYEKNVDLKKKLKNPLKENFLDTAYWIIRTWGHINLKRNKKNDKKLMDFRKKLDESATEFAKDEVAIIPSLSKVASFYRPEDYVIYDSRVVFSLNWLIFKNGLDLEYFHPLETRNTKLKAIDQKAIFQKAGRKVDYLSKAESYKKYCALLNETAKEMGENNYDLEMFLFSVADNYIISDMKNAGVI